ncbi:hypothetical protein Pryu01_02354 [Paraliobacillus ryukyuensis]|uniref:Uncharacterized protein n=1 Tax=Paraliobacillus ryukyuensis TaxID=200904 RepID=A0A366DWV6_9BACI|nr:hypothetical protein DES48_11057 [Paraliobacillus ryukyuensis]
MKNTLLVTLITFASAIAYVLFSREAEHRRDFH